MSRPAPQQQFTMGRGSDVTPDPVAYPICKLCHVPYVLRRGLLLTGGESWAWAPDCKHGARNAELFRKLPR